MLSDRFSDLVYGLVGFIRNRIHERMLDAQKMGLTFERQKLWQEIELSLYDIEDRLRKLDLLDKIEEDVAKSVKT